MMTDIPLLLQRGWENIWKEKILWFFGGLILLSPLVRFIPIHNSTGLLLSFLKLIKSFISLFLTTSSYAGVIYVAYCNINNIPVDIKATFLVIRKFFWHVALSFITIFLFLSPFFCLVLILSFKESIQAVDLAHNSYIFAIPSAIISALQYFLVIEIITSETLIWESLKTAWVVFKNRLLVLSVIGIILGVAWYAITIAIGITMILTKHGFDFAYVSKLDFISPQLSFTNNNLYELVTTIAQVVWEVYSASIFVLAYSKYKGVKKNRKVKF